MKTQRNFRLSEDDNAVLDAISQSMGANTSDSLRAIIADGLKLRMMRGTPPVDPHFLDVLTPPAVMREYLNYLDAVAGQTGLPGRDGQPSQYHFAKPPKGGEWERQGIQGWCVLENNVAFTKDGYRKA